MQGIDVDQPQMRLSCIRGLAYTLSMAWITKCGRIGPLEIPSIPITLHCCSLKYADFDTGIRWLVSGHLCKQPWPPLAVSFWPSGAAVCLICSDTCDNIRL